MNTFERIIAGREMTIRVPAQATLEALNRYRLMLVKKLDKLKDSDDPKAMVEARDLLTKFDMKLIVVIESLVIEEDDLDYLVDAQLRGETTPQQMISDILRIEEAPDDDEDPVVVVTKKAPNPLKKAQAAKKIANARRTKN